jgi:hypothetical protein
MPTASKSCCKLPKVQESATSKMKAKLGVPPPRSPMKMKISVVVQDTGIEQMKLLYEIWEDLGRVSY